MYFLTEEGWYEVLMQSRKPIAKEFKKQVKQILKEIRKHGMYATDELLDNSDFSKEYLKSESVMDINTLSKNLQKMEVPMGRNQLFEYLQKEEYIVKSGDFNIPSKKVY